MSKSNFLTNASVKLGDGAVWANRLLISAMVLCGSFLLALVAGSAFLPVEKSLAANTSVDIMVEISPVIALTTNADSTNSTLSIPITPTDSAGTLGTNDLIVDVHTNNLTGYNLTMNAQTSNTALVHSTTPSNTIPSTTAPLATPAALPTNQWGYWRWEDSRVATPTTFSRIPGTTADTLRTTTAPAVSSETTITFAANIDRMQPQGHYQNTVVFTATGNYVPPYIPAMQDFTAAKCTALTPGETIQLRDNRDDKVYRVRKMADNRCWMIDNLAFDLANTNAPTYSPSVALVSGTTTSVNTQAQYAQNIAAYNIPNNGNPTPSYLYNWCAAMGDTSTNCATTVAYGAGQPATPQTGICPAGWRLPIGGAQATTPGNGTNQATAAATTTNEFAKLDIYMGGTGTNRSSASAYTNFTTDNATNPQFFWLGVLGGSYFGGLYNQGSLGFWWSSTANSGTYAYGLYVYSGGTSVYPADGDSKLGGFAVRCIL